MPRGSKRVEKPMASDIQDQPPQRRLEEWCHFRKLAQQFQRSIHQRKQALPDPSCASSHSEKISFKSLSAARVQTSSGIRRRLSSEDARPHFLPSGYFRRVVAMAGEPFLQGGHEFLIRRFPSLARRLAPKFRCEENLFVGGQGA